MTQQSTPSYSSLMIIVTTTFYPTIWILPKYGSGKSGNKGRGSLGRLRHKKRYIIKSYFNKEESCGINLNDSGYSSVKGFRAEHVTSIEPCLYLTKQL
jgi:hypothetical protein